MVTGFWGDSMAGKSIQAFVHRTKAPCWATNVQKIWNTSDQNRLFNLCLQASFIVFQKQNGLQNSDIWRFGNAKSKNLIHLRIANAIVHASHYLIDNIIWYKCPKITSDIKLNCMVPGQGSHDAPARKHTDPFHYALHALWIPPEPLPRACSLRSLLQSMDCYWF